MTVTIWLLAAFVVLQLGVGLWIGRRVRGASDFFVAGRRLPPLLVFATFLAANIGAGSTVGAASIGYRIGLGAWWWNASAGIGSIALAFWAGPRLWEWARDRGFLTFGDFLEWRYGRVMRASASVAHLVRVAVDSGRPAAWRLDDPAGGARLAAMGRRGGRRHASCSSTSSPAGCSARRG